MSPTKAAWCAIAGMALEPRRSDNRTWPCSASVLSYTLTFDFWTRRWTILQPNEARRRLDMVQTFLRPLDYLERPIAGVQ